MPRNQVTPRPLTAADRRRPLPAAVEAVLDASPADAWDRIAALVIDEDDDERERIWALVCERLGLVRE